MRIRTLLSTALGAAAGAGAMYLLDPEHGPTRRVEARRSTLRQMRAGAIAGGRGALRAARSYAASARAGFDDASR